MKKTIATSSVIALTSFLFACSAVPTVESRLQSMQFHPNMYVVQAGESVESIAYRYKLTTAELETLNPGLTSNFAVGMRINVRPGTQLAAAVREGARVVYDRSNQPQILTERQVNTQTSLAATNPAVLSAVPVQTSPEPVAVAPTESILNQDDAVITEIPATSWSNERILVSDGNFTEEIVPDTLDYEPIGSAQVIGSGASAAQYGSEWIWPTDGQVAREFAPTEAGGQGVDIAGVPGQNIRAARGGTVVYSGRDLSGGGNLIIVRHNDQLMTTYSHADQLFVAEDDVVVGGDPIASLGWNADRESVLRFEVRENGNPLNPMNFLPLQ